MLGDRETTVEELVDKIINKSEKKIGRNNKSIKEETEPFRYITDEDEIKSVLTPEGVSPVNILNVPKEAKKVDDIDCTSGLGDTDTIKSVIQRHIKNRRNRK